MANTITHKRSTTSSDTPSASDLSAGEIAINTADGKLFIKKSDDSIVTFESGSSAPTGAQTGITSILNTNLVVGRDADNQIKFGTDNQIIFEVSGGDNVIFKASGEIEATSLDISGNADIDGTLEVNDAVTIRKADDVELIVHADTTSSPISQIQFIRGTTDTFGGDSYNDWKIENGYGKSGSAGGTLRIQRGYNSGLNTYWEWGVNGGVQSYAPFTVGVDDTGHDVKFFGATSGKYMEWDESADQLNVSGTLTAISTDTGNGSAPLIQTDRDSASPADWDYLGGFQYYGRNDADETINYAGLYGRIEDASDGTEDGRIEIYQYKNGSSTQTYAFGPDKFFFTNEQSIEWYQHGGTSYDVNLASATPSADRTITLPDATGTVALTSDLSGYVDTAGTGLTKSSSTLSVNSSQTQITSIGTIGTGVWQGTAIADAYIASASTWNSGATQGFTIAMAICL